MCAERTAAADRSIGAAAVSRSSRARGRWTAAVDGAAAHSYSLATFGFAAVTALALRGEGRKRRARSPPQKRRSPASRHRSALLEADRGDNRTSKTANWRVSSRGTRGRTSARADTIAASNARTGSGLGNPRSAGVEKTAQRVQNNKQGTLKTRKAQRRQSAPPSTPNIERTTGKGQRREFVHR